MEFQSYDLGTVKQGAKVEITLQGNAANVKLMDSTNFNRYKNGSRHDFFGGHITSSSTRLQVPRTSHWYVTVDLNGCGGEVSSSVRVIN